MHRTHRILSLSLVLAFGLTGCGKKDKEGGATDPATTPEPTTPEPSTPEPAADSGPFARYGVAEITARWQGAWVVGGSGVGHQVAWNVAGDKVTEWNGTAEKVMDFKVLAPCSTTTSETENGGTSTTYHVFAFDGDTLYAGLGNAGVITADGAFACISGKYYELAGATCTEWDLDVFGKWKSKPGECALTDGTFTAGTSTLETAGKALVNQQMKGNTAAKHADFAAAKAALPAK